MKVGVYLDGKLQSINLPADHALTSVPSPPNWVQGDFRGLVFTPGHVYFRAVSRQRTGHHTVSVISSLPLDAISMARAASGLGRMTLWPDVHLRAAAQHEAAGLNAANPQATPENPATRNSGSPLYARNRIRKQAMVSGGNLPKAENFLDIPINFPTTLNTWDWSSGSPITAVGLVTSRPSLLYRRLFRESVVIGGGIRIVLIFTAALFACLELLAIFLAARLSRTITQSVSGLYHATREVDRGRFDYRISVTRQDQLAALSRSFNTMSASLARLLEEQKEKERLQSELAIAQEVQANLFPARDLHMGALEVHGFCRPARSVSGDYYDFLVLDQHSLFMAVGDISGKGISAALLMASLHSAVRAYRLASQEMAPASLTAEQPADVFASPAALMRLLNLHLYRSTQQEKYATLFLAHYDARTCLLRYANGGQLPPLVLRRDGSIVRLDCGGTVVGLLDNMVYEQGAVTLEPGDLLVAYSDGVTEPENDFGDFGEQRLIELVRSNRSLPLDEIAARIVKALDDWIGAAEQPDDITLVLARQH